MHLHSSWARAWTAAALVTFSLTVPAAAQTADSRSVHPAVDIRPAQRLSRADALRAATIEGAYVSFEEDEKGSIELGKLADLVVVSDDPMTCAEIRIRDIRAELTIVGGRIVYDRSAA